MLRDYQQQASDAAYTYFTDKKAKYNAVMVVPTGGGKSLILAVCRPLRKYRPFRARRRFKA